MDQKLKNTRLYGQTLIRINDKLIAEEIKRILEESGIYSLLESDNPTSSVMNVYFGSATQDNNN